MKYLLLTLLLLVGRPALADGFGAVEAKLKAAGFEFVDFTDIHFRLDDELRYEVGRKTVTGNTDRWTLKFIKP